MISLEIKENRKIVNEMNKYLDGITIEGLLMVLMEMKGTFHFQVMFNEEQMREDVAVMDLSQRAINCLRRSGINTVGQLVKSFHTKEGETSKKQLRKLRNLGQNTADDILIKLFFHQFTVLSENRRKSYMDKILEMNGMAA